MNGYMFNEERDESYSVIQGIVQAVAGIVSR